MSKRTSIVDKNSNKINKLCEDVERYKERIKDYHIKLNDVKQQQTMANIIQQSNAEKFRNELLKFKESWSSYHKAVSQHGSEENAPDIRNLRTKWQELVNETAKKETDIQNIMALMVKKNHNLRLGYQTESLSELITNV